MIRKHQLIFFNTYEMKLQIKQVILLTVKRVLKSSACIFIRTHTSSVGRQWARSLTIIRRSEHVIRSAAHVRGVQIHVTD